MRCNSSKNLYEEKREPLSKFRRERNLLVEKGKKTAIISKETIELDIQRAGPASRCR